MKLGQVVMAARGEGIVANVNETHARVVYLNVSDDGPTKGVIENAATQDSHPGLLYAVHVACEEKGWAFGGFHVDVSMEDVPLDLPAPKPE